MNSRSVAPVTRRFVAVTLGAAVVLGATGCNLLARQATSIPYAPSDGIDVPDSSGVLELRNVLIVADEDGVDGNLVAAIVNSSDEAQTLNLEFGRNGAGGSATVRVPAGEVVSLGTAGTDPLLFEGIDTMPGATLTMYFQSGDGEGTLAMVPVLDGALPQYADLVPAGVVEEE